MKDLISVIIPAYKVERYIEDCINSITEQTYTNLEIILVDDGSPDNCPQIIDGYAKKDNRIKVIHKENGGISSARNAGLQIATGEYVTFIDSDDTADKKMYEILYNLLKKYDADVAMCEVLMTSENENGKIIKSSLESKELKEEVLTCDAALELMITNGNVGNFVCTKLFKKELFNDISFPEGRVYEDAATTYKVIHKCKKIAYTNEGLYNYLVGRVGAITSNFSEKKILDSLDAYSSQYEFLIKNHKSLKNVASVTWTRLYTSAMEKICMNNYIDLWNSKEVIEKYDSFVNAIDELNEEILKEYLEPYRLISSVLLRYNRNVYKDMFKTIFENLKSVSK